MTPPPVCAATGKLCDLTNLPPMVVENLDRAGVLRFFQRNYCTYTPELEPALRGILDRIEIDRTHGVFYIPMKKTRASVCKALIAQAFKLKASENKNDSWEITGNQQGKFPMIHTLMRLLIGLEIWGPENTIPIETMEVPHSSELTAFNKTFPSLLTSTNLSTFLDMELLSYIRPPLNESQKKQIVEKFQGGVASRNLPEMAPLGRAESIQGTRPGPSTQEDMDAPPIDLRGLAISIIGTTESSKKRTKDQA
ncbi:hypothetical protein R1sor_024530 [Riccia sorocarpa]|uniref:Uncharacterized protein n=1 Tax=Riccia sorocarpa TaxID=122646 RepID=A0ABD3GWT7_9MARC